MSSGFKLEPPQLRTSDERGRHATWLELFFDLVFVVAVSQLAHTLGHDTSAFGVAAFIALFVPVWWAWVGSTFYANRFDTDDVEYRLLTAAEMFGVVALAVNVPHALDTTSTGFALSYAVVRSVLVVKYLRAYRHVPAARPLTGRYAIGFGIDALLWTGSVILPPPYRYVLWIVGLTISILTPITAGRLHVEFAPHHEHLPERFGLFTIIVLGESFIGVVVGVTDQRWTAGAAVLAAFGVVIAFGLWWLYFEQLGEETLQVARQRGSHAVYQLWLYTHFPIVASLTAIGVGVQHVLLTPPGALIALADLRLLLGSLVVYLLSLIVLNVTATWFRPTGHSFDSSRLIGVALAAAVGLAAPSLSPRPLTAGIAALCCVLVILEIHGHEEPSESIQ